MDIIETIKGHPPRGGTLGYNSYILNYAMRVLITGSNGYLGSVLGDHLISNGIHCDGIDTGFFNDCNLYNHSTQVKYKQKDARYIDESDLTGYDVVVHLAGISNDPMGKMSSAAVYDPEDILRKIAFAKAKNQIYICI